MNFCLPILLVTIVFVIFDAEQYIRTAYELFTVWLLLLLYG